MTLMKSSRTIRGICNRNAKRLMVLVAANLCVHAAAYAAESRTCHRWLERIVQHSSYPEAKGSALRSTVSVLSSDPWAVASMGEAEKMKAIQCLLGAENDLRPAAFSGATRPDISQTFAPARVNLAALYAVSYIYTGHYDHAGAVALRGDDASYTDAMGNYVTKERAIHRAYRAYRTWFAKVRQIGLAKSEQLGLRPLHGTGLRWY